MTGQSTPSRFLRVLTVLCFAIIVSLVWTMDSNAESKSEPKTELFHNEDCTNFFWYHDIPDGKAGETIDRYIDVIADAGVTALLFNTNSRRTNYRSDVWDAFWDGYDPDGPDDQPFLKPVPPANIKSYRKGVGNMLKVHKQGVDFPARVVQRCRKRGVSPWITLRMNDCHYNSIPNHPFHGMFWQKNPQFARQNCPGYYATCLDYARPEVRDYFMKLIEETLDRYDIDGLELDFMREPYIFSNGKEAEGAPIFTEWIRQIRKKIDAAAAKRGHTVQLCIRVPSRPETALAMGFEAVDWAKEGLVDVLVATPRWATLEFDMPLQEWKRLLAGTKTKLLGGLEVRYHPCPGSAASLVSPQMATGAALSVLSSGADAVYLFNFFQDGHPQWPPAVYQKMLSSMRSLDSLVKLPRRVCVTYRDIIGPGENYRPPLPASGKEIVFPFKLGPVSKNSVDCELLIGLLAEKKSLAPAPAVTVNGKACKVLSDNRLKKIGERQIVFSVLREALKPSGAQDVKITAKGASPLKLMRLEMSLGD